MEGAVKILVVDDDRRIVKTTCDILRIKGHLPVAAFSGEEAVAMLKAEQPECVLMDIKMPGINGVEAMQQMRAIAPTLPVILVSAYASDELIDQARRSGAYAVLPKPLNFEMILSFLSLLRKEESVLIVDDDPNFCRTLKDVLMLRGYRVETEVEAARVLGDLKTEHKLVIVLDINLGDTNGVDVLREIRSMYPAMPVVLVTGYRDEMGEVIEKGLRIGAYTCLYKPFEVEELLRPLEEIRLAKLKNLLVPS
jgi:DNA-binding NtrC family response regulator